MQKIILVGRLGRDAAIRETQEGSKIVSFTMAVNGRFRGTEKTSWYDVSTFNYERYRNMVKYLTKGSLVSVTGDLDADIEEGRDGVTRCRRYVTADSIEFGPSNSSGSTSNDRTEETPRRARRQETEPDDISDDELQMTRKPSRRAEEDEDENPPRRSSSRAARAEEYDDTEEPPVKAKKNVKDEEAAPAKKTAKRPAPVEDDEDESELPF
jgi:single-strand DNA-binding protein